MKVNWHGQAKILSQDDLAKLFNCGFQTNRDKALFAICLFTGCRISEAIQLRSSDVRDGVLVFRKSTTKGKLRTREMDIMPGLQYYIDRYQPNTTFLFPGLRGVTEHLTRSSADKILRSACQKVGIDGVSTHSFRRTALTQMSNSGVPLRIIQQVSGHKDLGVLQVYLEVAPEQVTKALSVIGW